MTVDGIFEHFIKCSGELSLHSTCVSRPPTAQACVGVDYGWPDNRINLYSWYQRCTFTFGLKWGPRNRWEPFSTSWKLPSSQLKPIYDTCGSICDPLRSFPTATPPPLTNVSHVLVPNPTPLPVPSTPFLPVPISTPLPRPSSLPQSTPASSPPSVDDDSNGSVYSSPDDSKYSIDYGNSPE